MRVGDQHPASHELEPGADRPEDVRVALTTEAAFL